MCQALFNHSLVRCWEYFPFLTCVYSSELAFGSLRTSVIHFPLRIKSSKESCGIAEAIL